MLKQIYEGLLNNYHTPIGSTSYKFNRTFFIEHGDNYGFTSIINDRTLMYRMR